MSRANNAPALADPPARGSNQLATDGPATPQARAMVPIKRLFESEEGMKRVKAVVPAHVKPDRVVRMAMLAISQTPDLLECTPDSLFLETVNAAALGLEIGKHLGQAYLVPFYDHGTKKAQLIIGYRGMIHLARQSEEIATIAAYVVREGDEFEFSLGIEDKVVHVPGNDLTKPITHVWAKAVFKDKSYHLERMTIAEVNAIRQRSKASTKGPWVTDFAEMAKKTVVRRLCKYLPMTPEAAEAVERNDRVEFGDFVETTATPVADRVKNAIGEGEKKDAAALPEKSSTTPAEQIIDGEVVTREPAPAEPVSDADKFEDERAKGQA